MEFQFEPKARELLGKLCRAQELSNATSRFSGHVYGKIAAAIDEVVKLEQGEAIAKLAREHIDYGANGSWLADLKAAVEKAHEVSTEDEDRKLRRQLRELIDKCGADELHKAIDEEK